MSKEDNFDYILDEATLAQEEEFEIVDFIEKIFGTIKDGIRGILPDEEFIY
ncbi:MAG: hypothetical protein H6622_08080 [Halobacteriovoraceae bacterium]|nr:hypothetical protein [Halobacteriovoraceae bacterium]